MALFLYTDFGIADPYVGQVHAAIAEYGWTGPVIDLFHNAPNFDVQASGYLLAALTESLPLACVVLAVVDPGVGGARAPIMVQAGRRWLVGPDNGLLSVVMARAERITCARIDWRPQRLSASFHGRDLFAPVAAMLARGEIPAHTADFAPIDTRHWPPDLPQVIYIDHYGNAMTGVRASQLTGRRKLQINGQIVSELTTFSEAPPGTPFWYCNANGLVEIAMNRASAADFLALSIGTPITLL